MQRCLLFVGLLFCTVILSACSKEKSESNDSAFLELTIENQMDGAPLQLNAPYFNAFGEDLTISRLKYYVSNLFLINGSNATLLPDTYFLVDEQNAASRNIRLSIPTGDYTGIGFVLGVDSARNVSGAQTGALDPALDMFWTWNTGYIFAKLEGTSTASTAPGNRIQYHIGGFSGVNNALRVIVLDLPTNLSVKRGNTLQVTAAAEIQNWFQSIHDMEIANTPAIMTPGPAATQFADNYTTMFTTTSAQVK